VGLLSAGNKESGNDARVAKRARVSNDAKVVLVRDMTVTVTVKVVKEVEDNHFRLRLKKGARNRAIYAVTTYASEGLTSSTAPRSFHFIIITYQ
jgi:hypothetical protein